MLAFKPKQSLLRRAFVQALIVLSLTVSLAGAVCAGNAGAEPLYPQALMNWMVDGSFHALIVDKSQQRLSVWRIQNGEPSVVESFRCSTGENDGDKWVRGDMKTPEGVYFFCSVIDGRTLPAKYGSWAFTTDYPNFVDRRHGKSGDGIWLHGRDKPLNGKPDSNGCIALENHDLVRVSQYVKLQSTPLIVVNRLIMAPQSAIIEQERKLRDFIEAWRRSWESRDADFLMSHYSMNFQSAWLDFKAWKEKKRKLSQRYRTIKVQLGNVFLYRQNGIITAIFPQVYNSDGFRSTGIKVLYITELKEKFGIYAEDYHQPVDDPFPVGPLLARVKGELPQGIDSSAQFRIRLVSTDEPDPGSYGDEEAPRPVVPSRGVVLEKTASIPAKELQPPALDVNEKSGSGQTPERLVVVRLMPVLEQPPSIEAPRIARNPSRPQTVFLADLNSRDQAVPEAVRAHNGWAEAAAAVSAEPPVVEAVVSSRHAAPVETQTARSEVTAQDRKDISDFLAKWKRAWMQKDLDRFIKMYHPDYQQLGMDYKMFLKSKKNFFRKYQAIRVEVDQLEIGKTDGRWVVKFLQSFQGDDYRDKGWKTMVLAGGKAEGFRILEEGWSPL
jgi:murein L,D-transpeptidase YafK